MRRSTRKRLSTAISAALVAGLAVVAPTSAGAASAPLVFDDMEHGDPFNNGWFTFGGSVGGGGINANTADLPPADGGSFSLETGWGSGGTPGFYGGFGRTLLTDTTGTDHFNLWINPDAGQEYTLEINLQEDDNVDDAANAADDDEFQFNCVVSETGPCASSGGGWQLVSIPLSEFFDDNSFFTGGNGVLDPVPAPAGNGQLVNVVVAVIGTGSDVNFRTDYWAFSDGPLTYTPTTVVDDFESGIAPGSACVGIPLGFCTFAGTASVSISNPGTPPAPERPEVGSPNGVLQMDVQASDFAGFIHGFTNSAGDTWTPQNWSANEGISFWMYGNGSNTQMFVDILDNRNPGSTTDDAERFTVAFRDDFTGWKLLEFPFADFVRKDIGNGAPNDGLTLFEVHGYAIGTLGTGGERTFYFDDVSRYGVGQPPALAANFAQAITFIEEGTTGDVSVKLNRAMGPDDPAEVSIDYATERSNAIPDQDFTPTSGTLTFTNGGPRELTFPVETFDNSKFAGDKQIVIRLTNPQGMERGSLFQGSVLIDDNEKFDPKLLDDFEQGAYLWSADPELEISTATVRSGDALERPDQDAVETIMEVATPLVVDIDVMGSTCKAGKGVVPVHVLSTPDFDATQIDHTTVKFGDASEIHTSGKAKTPTRHEEDVNGDGLMDLVFHFGASQTGYDCDSTDVAITGALDDGTPIVGNGAPIAFGRDFAVGQNWAKDAGLSFWYYGSGTGDEVTVSLKDNRAPQSGPGSWTPTWSDEFDGPAGSVPDPAKWAYEIGDTTPDGKNGWGNEERQYYTDDPKNAQTDGAGNLVITLDEADGSQECYYGPCEYESARLITQNRAEFAYGRIESRLKVPGGGNGLWPAFWSLGTDITYNPWPGAGEIDIMEYVSRVPNEIFGTIHGPGYSGGQSFGGIYDFGSPVRDDWHTYAVEWEPDEIRWYVDDILYHTATPADVAPNEWVFDKPFFLLLNFAIGGNFGGAIDPANTYPQEYLLDYVRVFQSPDTAERFEATFTDAASGWQRVTVPFGDFTRSAEQPAGAPDDGLGLNEVWGYGFELPKGGTATGTVRVDLVNVDRKPKPATVTVTTLADSGDGSLRQSLEEVATGGTIQFDPSLAGGTVELRGPLVPTYDVVVDASDAPGLSLDGGGSDRVLLVNAGVDVTFKALTITNGYGFQLGGGVLNNGALTLDRVAVTGNTMTTDGGDFWQGGGGIYNGDGASLTLVDSTVSDNDAGWSGGGVYSFFNTTTSVVRSTISDNTSADVGGGLRTLGAVAIDNSTISGNTSTAWHGGAMFVTDGAATITSSTITANAAPAGTTGGIFVGTFGASSATVELRNSIVAGNTEAQCFPGYFGGGAVTLAWLGSNVLGDATCQNGTPGAGDQIVADALLGPLADNGGPTRTHALGAGSPAIDAADPGSFPATDQRGVSRPQGDGPDVGSFEVQ